MRMCWKGKEGRKQARREAGGRTGERKKGREGKQRRYCNRRGLSRKQNPPQMIQMKKLLTEVRVLGDGTRNGVGTQTGAAAGKS